MLSSFLRSSHPSVFYKKGFLKKFSKFTEKQLLESLFNKVAGLRHATLFKKRLRCKYIPLHFEKFLKTSFYTENFWWLLLFSAAENGHEMG